MKKFTVLMTILLTACSAAHAGVLVEDANKKVLGFAAKIECDAGITCSVDAAKVKMSAPGTNGLTPFSSGLTNFDTWAGLGVVTNATSATPSATAVQMSQVYIPFNVTLTGIKVLNAATCGTNKWIVALFNSAGVAVANSALAGTLCSGASGFQTIAFTATYAAKGPGTYWIGVYADGTTDRYYAIPAAGQGAGLSGTVTGQTFGTIASVTLPTTFTADKGPVAFTY